MRMLDVRQGRTNGYSTTAGTTLDSSVHCQLWRATLIVVLALPVAVLDAGCRVGCG